jgi:hypothetical protein
MRPGIRLYAFDVVSRNFGRILALKKPYLDLVEHNGSDQSGSEAAG